MNLAGKVVVITGASGGIGAACAKAFRKAGARLALAARNPETLGQVAEDDALAVAGDLTLPETRARLVSQTLNRYGRIDVLVNNAGVGLYAPSASSDPEQTRAMFELNFFTPLALVQLVRPVMSRQGSGLIVNVASIAGKVALPWLTLYSASKFALCGWSDGLRMELRADGIRVMTICPGYVSSDFQANVLQGEPPPALRGSKPLMISPEECARSLIRGVERGARTVVTPSRGWLFVAAARLLPGLVDRRLESILRKPR